MLRALPTILLNTEKEKKGSLYLEEYVHILIKKNRKQ
jgi:hypothetical protein